MKYNTGRRGEIGRRNRLKICRGQLCVGSTPTAGIKLSPSVRVFFCPFYMEKDSKLNQTVIFYCF